jgi:rare lipoprotein A
MKLRSTLLAATAVLATLGAAQAQQASAPPAAPAASEPAAAPAPAPMAAPAPAPMAAPTSDVSEGKVAYYGAKFNGRKTASGERFNAAAMTMAHKSLPFGTRVKVTNLANNKSVVVRVNDRGPTTPERIGDLSSGAARKIGMTRAGVIDAKLEVVGQAPVKSAK